MRGRFTLWPSGDSRSGSHLSAGAAASCASEAILVSTTRAAPPVAGASRGAEVAAQRKAKCVFHTLAPALEGSLPPKRPLQESYHAPLSGRRINESNRLPGLDSR